MRFSFKKTVLASAVALGMGAGAAEASVVLTFADTHVGNNTALAGACSSIAWGNDANFRMCDPTGAALGGGLPAQKDAMMGGETWSFNDAGVMTAVGGTPGNPGTTPAGTASFPGSAAPLPGSNGALQQPADFFGSMFNFLAPTSGSLAGNAYGTGSLVGGNVITNGTTTFTAPVLEAQWAGTWFPLGQASGGITFVMDITATSATTFDFVLRANELIDGAEDPGAAGFSNWTAQWFLTGSGATSGAHSVAVSAIPVPAAVWLFGSGLLGLASIARRKKKA
jgi:hypothetical protein